MISNNTNSKLNISNLVFSFLPVLFAVCLQYVVIIGDIIVLFIHNMLSDEKSIVTRSAGTVLTQDYNQPMNLAYISLIKYILYIVVFGIWYYRAFVKDYIIDNIGNYTGKNNEISTGKIKASFSRNLLCLAPVFLIIAGIAAQFLVDGVLTLVRPLLEQAFAHYDKIVSSVTGAASSWVTILTVAVIAPIGEELLFRGLIQSYSKEYLSAVWAIILQAAVFGVYHGNVIQGAYAFLLGMLLGLIAHRFESILPAIIFHIAINACVFFVPQILFETTVRTVITTVVAGIVLFAGVFMALLHTHTPSHPDPQHTQEV